MSRRRRVDRPDELTCLQWQSGLPRELINCGFKVDADTVADIVERQ
ncbi:MULTISPECIES: hypothetical protein [Haloferacaceae]|uniref:Uncharacterized protein n=1 Tax=Halorubrum glutamatedens TaxID=2707018 RepID=A0ABD5QWR1_9EURY|nr:hypothetical protein [Halobellus captivus]